MQGALAKNTSSAFTLFSSFLLNLDSSTCNSTARVLENFFYKFNLNFVDTLFFSLSFFTVYVTVCMQLGNRYPWQERVWEENHGLLASIRPPLGQTGWATVGTRLRV